MTDDSSWKAFEKLNHRIERLVQGAGATVEWNGSLIDPDTGVTRQIDVLITGADGKRSSVECREHAVSQSVKWIEELIGRKMSLRLDGMIAVSVKGFSAPAAKKAACFGITLYDYDRLTDAEIASWGGVVQVESVFVQFEHMEILAGIPDGARNQLAADPSATVFAYKGGSGFGALFDAVGDQVAAQPGVTHQRVLDPTGFSVDGIPLTLLSCSFAGKLVMVGAFCMYVALVDDPGTARALRSIDVQRFDHTVSEIIQVAGEAHLQIDASTIQVPPNAMLYLMRTRFPRPTHVSRYELIGNRRIESVTDAFALNIVTTS